MTTPIPVYHLNQHKERIEDGWKSLKYLQIKYKLAIPVIETGSLINYLGSPARYPLTLNNPIRSPSTPPPFFSPQNVRSSQGVSIGRLQIISNLPLGLAHCARLLLPVTLTRCVLPVWGRFYLYMFVWVVFF